MSDAPLPGVNEWWLSNVRIETGIHEDSYGTGHTETAIGSVRVVGETITDIRLEGPVTGVNEPVVDGDELLLMPSMIDTHLHLDKTFYGGLWRSPSMSRGWLEEEERLLPEMSADIPRRSNAILDLLVSSGTTGVVAHCNVDHIVGTRNVERLLEVLDTRRDVSCTVVAYPQHGMQAGKITPLLDRALELGATAVGGLDPSAHGGDTNGTIDAVFGLAREHDVDVDFHIHDGGSLGLFEISRIIDKTVAIGWQGRVALSAAGGLSAADPSTLADAVARLAEAQISIGATMSVGGATLPIPQLDEAGVRVSLGSDSIVDILTPFGPGDIVTQLWLLAQRYGCRSELALAQTVHFGAGGLARWSGDGTPTWPTRGDRASFMLVDASSSAEAIARRCERRRVFHDGRLTYAAEVQARSWFRH
jgi:cytosine/adenosine deaminase-related metal-dependent hydrolase